MLQLAQSARVGTKQLTADLIYIRRQLNASDTDIDDVSTGISDVMATVTRLMTSAQAVQDNITMTSSHAANLSDATLNVTQLEADATSVDSQVCSHSSAVMLPLKSSSFREVLSSANFIYIKHFKIANILAVVKGANLCLTLC